MGSPATGVRIVHVENKFTQRRWKGNLNSQGCWNYVCIQKEYCPTGNPIDCKIALEYYENRMGIRDETIAINPKSIKFIMYDRFR